MSEKETEENLILGGDEPTGDEVEYFEDVPDLHSEIASASNALAAVAELDLAMMPKKYTPMVQTIRRKALAIIAENINSIHTEVFGRNEDEQDEEE